MWREGYSGEMEEVGTRLSMAPELFAAGYNWERNASEAAPIRNVFLTGCMGPHRYLTPPSPYIQRRQSPGSSSSSLIGCSALTVEVDLLTPSGESSETVLAVHSSGKYLE